VSCNYSYYVRVTQQPPDAHSGIFIYTKPITASTTASAPTLVTEFRLSGKPTLCFSEDPASTVKQLEIGIEQCPSCSMANWDSAARTLSVNVSAPSIGSGGGLLLIQATSGGTTYKASNNPQIDGGRPIIRNTLDPAVILVVAVIAAGIIYMLGRRFFGAKKLAQKNIT
jgi:hypothetical protein